MHRARIIIAVLSLFASVSTKAVGQQRRNSSQDEPLSKSACLIVKADHPVDTIFQAGTHLIFIAQVPDKVQHQQLTFNWSVSAGTITNGQNTSTITVDTIGLSGQPITATIEVGGLPLDCPKTASATMTMLPFMCGLPLDEYGVIGFEDEQARLDNFANELQASPAAQGYIINYGGRRGRAHEAQARAERAVRYLYKYRHIDAGRIVTVDGGYREEATTVLYIVPPGATLPTPSPTVAPSEVNISNQTKRRRNKKQ